MVKEKKRKGTRYREVRRSYCTVASGSDDDRDRRPMVPVPRQRDVSASGRLLSYQYTVSFTHATATSCSNFDSIINAALEACKQETDQERPHIVPATLQTSILRLSRCYTYRPARAKSPHFVPKFSTWLAPAINITLPSFCHPRRGASAL